MSAATSHPQPVVIERRGIRFPRVGLLLLGVIVIPLVLGIALNSYGALTAESAVRMAFATIAGQTVAILSALAVLIVTIVHRRDAGQIAVFVAIAVLVTLIAIGAMSEAGDTLLVRLDLVARTDLLNQ